MTSTLLEHVEQTQTEEDAGRMSHIVYPKSMLTDAIINGTAVQALCGHTWVPGRDPKRYPICQACKEIFESIHGKIDDDIQ